MAIFNGYVDGKVSVYEAELVAVSLGDAGDHVGDVGADGAYAREFLLVAKPLIHADLLANFLDIKRLVLEGLGELATGSLYGNHARLDGHFHSLGNVNIAGSQNCLHLFQILDCRV